MRPGPDAPAETPAGRREQLLAELDAYQALPASHRTRLERRLACTASLETAERRRRNICTRAIALLVTRHRGEFLELAAREGAAAGGRA